MRLTRLLYRHEFSSVKRDRATIAMQISAKDREAARSRNRAAFLLKVTATYCATAKNRLGSKKVENLLPAAPREIHMQVTQLRPREPYLGFLPFSGRKSGRECVLPLRREHHALTDGGIPRIRIYSYLK